jgi:hypothetical protein
VHRQPDLLQVVGALHASSGFSSRLDGGQQKADQNSDDGDDHQQLHERETTLPTIENATNHKTNYPREKESQPPESLPLPSAKEYGTIISSEG